jgi:hypothetical protein
MNFDNERDQHTHGYDAGQIVDGTVTWDPEKGRYVLVDEDGVGYDVQEVMKSLNGQKIRLTMISLTSMEEIQKMLEQVQGNQPS